MKSLLAAALLLAGGCSDRTDPANNAQAESSESNLSDSRNEAAVRRPAALEGLRSICFGFDLGSMTEATLNDMIRSIDGMTAAYRRLGVELSHESSSMGAADAIDKCRAATSATAGADEIRIVAVAGDNGGTRLSFRRGEHLENSRVPHEPRTWMRTYLDTQIGHGSGL